MRAKAKPMTNIQVQDDDLIPQTSTESVKLSSNHNDLDPRDLPDELPDDEVILEPVIVSSTYYDLYYDFLPNDFEDELPEYDNLRCIDFE